MDPECFMSYICPFWIIHSNSKFKSSNIGLNPIETYETIKVNDSYFFGTKYNICTSIFQLKFGPSEKGTKFEKNFHLKFDATE